MRMRRILCLGDSLPRMAFDNAHALIFTGADVEKFLDGLSSNKVEINNNKVIDTLLLDNKAKIIAQLHIFKLNNMYISVTIADNFNKMIDYLNGKILSQDVTISNVSNLNHIDLLYNEGQAHDEMKQSGEITQIGVNNLYCVEIYSKKLDRLYFDGDEKSFTDWRIRNSIPWYGYEISSSVNPYQCGLGYQVHENKGCFTGQEILTRMRTRNKGIYRLVCRVNSDSHTSIPSTRGSEASLYLEKI